MTEGKHTAPTIYLASPIDLSPKMSRETVSTARGLAADAAEKVGAVLYDPASAFMVPPGTRPTGTIADINNIALRHCDGLLALYPEAGSIGVPMEIAQAYAAGIPITIVSDALARSWSLAGIRFAHRIPGNTYLQHPETVLSALVGRVYDRWDKMSNLAFGDEPRDVLPMVVESSVPGVKQGYSDDAGFDLYCATDMEIAPGTTVDVPCGVSMKFPAGIFGIIVGRSSTLRTHNLLVNLGVIDTGYTGTLFANCRNLNDETFQVKRGMRLAQIIPLNNVAATLSPTPVESLEQTTRGQRGFGSSGT